MDKKTFLAVFSGVGGTLLGLIIGWVVNEGAAGRATREAMNQALPHVIEATQDAGKAKFEAEISAERSRTILKEAQETATRIKDLDKIATAMKNSEKFADEIAKLLLVEGPLRKALIESISQEKSLLRAGDKIHLVSHAGKFEGDEYALDAVSSEVGRSSTVNVQLFRLVGQGNQQWEIRRAK